MKAKAISIVSVLALTLAHASAQDGAPTTQPAAPPAPAQTPAEPAERVAAPAAVVRPYMGLTVRLVDPESCRALGLPEEVGLKVEYVDPGGPAAAAGFRRGDVLHKLGDQVLVNPHQLRVLLWTHKPGDVVAVHGFRAGEPKTINLTLGKRPDEPKFARPSASKLQKIQPGHINAKPQRTIVFGDKEHRLRITDDENGRHLTCSDTLGNVVFDGYIDTEADIAALPEVVKQKLGKMQQLQQRRGVQIEMAPLLPPAEAEPARRDPPPREKAENETVKR